MRLAKSIGVASIAMLLLFLINIQGNKKMSFWNPATWTVVDNLQGQNGGGWNTLTTSPSGPSTQPATPTVSQPSTPQVQGASVEGAMYFDTNTGKMQGVGGSNLSNAPSGYYDSAPAAPAADPYARFGGTQAYNNLVSGFQTGLNDINTTGNSQASQLQTKYGLDINDYVNTLRASQTGIDNQSINNFANQQLGQRQVNQMVGEGVNSAGVMLANKNAGDSSATEAIARAYGQVGQNRMQGVNNQFEAGNRDIQAAQEQLDITNAAGINRIKTEAQMGATSIVDSARNELAALKQRQLTADLPTSIEIEQEIQGIIGRTNQAVAAIDAQLTQKTGGVKKMGTNSAQSRAYSNNNAGIGPTNYQNYTSEMPTQMRGGASVPSSLPIFTYRGNKSEF